MKRIVGIFLISLPFIGLFFWGCYVIGIFDTIIVYLLTLIVCAILYLGIYLVEN